MAFTILERRLRDILHRVTSIYPGARSQHTRGTFVRSQRTSIGSSPRRTDEQHRQLKQYLESYWWGNPGDPSSAVATAASHSVNDLCSYFPNTSIPNQGHGSGESTSNRSRVKIQKLTITSSQNLSYTSGSTRPGSVSQDSSLPSPFLRGLPKPNALSHLVSDDGRGRVHQREVRDPRSTRIKGRSRMD
jgi:hypothetical protein